MRLFTCIMILFLLLVYMQNLSVIYAAVDIPKDELIEIIKKGELSEKVKRTGTGRADLRGADLSGEDLSGVVLEGADLRGARFKGSNLSKARICHAIMNGIDLHGINLFGASLRRAKLHEADLSSAQLTESILSVAELNEAKLEGADLQRAALNRTSLIGAKLQGANLTDADLSNAYLLGANLSGAFISNASFPEAKLMNADLSNAALEETNFFWARLEDANLTNANLKKADLRGATLIKANLSGANLSEANLSEANLSRADLSGADMHDVDLRWADLSKTVYEPKTGTLPDIPTVALAKNLSTLTFRQSPHGLYELREALKKVGMRKQEREVTFAIQHNKRLMAWEEGFPGKAGSVLKLVLFEYTCEYGMSSGRAMWIFWGLIAIFAIPYAVSLKTRKGQDGIWRVWSENRLRKDLGEDESKPLTVGILRAMGYGIYFSMLSAFHIGWRDLNVGNWIARIQPREYTLRATGWVRTVSGIQSLISVYLLVLWVLTYFGRPFDWM